MKKLSILLCILFFSLNIQAQHLVSLKNGEKMNGKVQSLSNGIVDFLYKGNVMKLKISEIYSITFGETGESGGGLTTAAGEREVGEKQITSGAYKVRYKVADRIITRAPKIDNLTQEKGTVIVDVTIDKYGHVLKANPGAPGSTTNSEYLKTKAMQAAESTLFDNIPTAPLETKGYIVISF
jgi:hypothetical protein